MHLVLWAICKLATCNNLKLFLTPRLQSCWLYITGRCSTTKVILWVRRHSQISIAKLHSYLEWASLFDWCKSLPQYCLTWLGQCNDSDLSQNSWELGILLVVPDNLYCMLIPQLTITPCLILTICGPYSELEASDSIDIFIPGGKDEVLRKLLEQLLKTFLHSFILLLVTWPKFYAN